MSKSWIVNDQQLNFSLKIGLKKLHNHQTSGVGQS